jgi:ISXO2 transposase-like protein
MASLSVNGEKLRAQGDQLCRRIREGECHTNSIENFWSLLKRGIKGTYVSVEPFHLFRYLDEQSFRFNTRKDNDQGRFMAAMSSIVGKRMEYKNRIGQTTH